MIKWVKMLFRPDTRYDWLRHRLDDIGFVDAEDIPDLVTAAPTETVEQETVEHGEDDIVERLEKRTIRTLPKDWKKGRKCPECGAGADLPKCMFDMGGSCPRHDPGAYDDSPWVEEPDPLCAEAARRLRSQEPVGYIVVMNERDEHRLARVFVYDNPEEAAKAVEREVRDDRECGIDWRTYTIHPVHP